MVDAHIHLNFVTELATDPNTTSGICIHALDCANIALLDTQTSHSPPQDLSGDTVKCFLKVDKGKIERFLCSMVFLSQLADNKVYKT